MPVPLQNVRFPLSVPPCCSVWRYDELEPRPAPAESPVVSGVVAPPLVFAPEGEDDLSDQADLVGRQGVQFEDGALFMSDVEGVVGVW